MTTRTTRRRGVSLIELLVVVGLIGLLSALTAGTVFRLRAAQDQNNTEGTLSKVHSNMQSRWSAILDQAKKDVPQALIDGLAEGDKDRAIAIWSYAKLKNEFPESRTEATAPINLNIPPGIDSSLILKPRKVFSGLDFTNVAPDDDSAVLIAAALYGTGNSGGVLGTDGIQNQMSDYVNPTSNLKGPPCFKDSWGSPIHFKRLGTSTEINNEPFCRPTTIRVATGGTFVIKNPFDPLGKLLLRNPTTLNTWATPGNINRGNAAFALGLATPRSNSYEFLNANVIPTLISYGKNKKLGTATTKLAGGDDDADDNVLSFRLRREGDRGN